MRELWPRERPLTDEAAHESRASANKVRSQAAYTNYSTSSKVTSTQTHNQKKSEGINNTKWRLKTLPRQMTEPSTTSSLRKLVRWRPAMARNAKTLDKPTQCKKTLEPQSDHAKCSYDVGREPKGEAGEARNRRPLRE